MPLEEAPLAKWCGGSANLCGAVGLNCSKCKSTNKKLAEKKLAELKKTESNLKS